MLRPVSLTGCDFVDFDFEFLAKELILVFVIETLTYLKSKKISNDQELIQSAPTSD